MAIIRFIINIIIIKFITRTIFISTFTNMLYRSIQHTEEHIKFKHQQGHTIVTNLPDCYAWNPSNF